MEGVQLVLFGKVGVNQEHVNFALWMYTTQTLVVSRAADKSKGILL